MLQRHLREALRRLAAAAWRPRCHRYCTLGCEWAAHVREQLNLAGQTAAPRQRAEAAACTVQHCASVALARCASVALILCWTVQAAASPSRWSSQHCVHSRGYMFVVPYGFPVHYFASTVQMLCLSVTLPPPKEGHCSDGSANYNSPLCWSSQHCVHSCGILLIVHGMSPCITGSHPQLGKG